MPRPRKTGLEYFPLDCQMDDKIEMLEAEHGMEGFGVYIRLLQHCYQQEDGKLDMSVVFRWKTLGKTLGILAENLRKMVDTMLEIDLFDRKTFDEEQKLTSNGIQKRISSVSSLREKERLRKAKPDLEQDDELSGGKQGNSGRKSTQRKEKKKNSNSSSDAAASEGEGGDEYTLTHKIRLTIEKAYPGYAWSAKDAWHADKLGEKLAVSFRTTKKREPTDEDLIKSLSTLLARIGKLAPYYQFQDVPKLNERYNGIVTQIKLPGTATNGATSTQSGHSGRVIT